MIRDAWRQRSVRPSDRRQPERCSGSDADGTKRLTSFSTDRPFAFRLYTIGQRLCPRDRVPKHSLHRRFFLPPDVWIYVLRSATKIDSSGYETDIGACEKISTPAPARYPPCFGLFSFEIISLFSFLFFSFLSSRSKCVFV